MDRKGDRTCARVLALETRARMGESKGDELWCGARTVGKGKFKPGYRGP